jgi:hypothetical protein
MRLHGALGRVLQDHDPIDVQELWMARQEPRVIRSLDRRPLVERDQEPQPTIEDVRMRGDGDQRRQRVLRERIDLHRVRIVEGEHGRQVVAREHADHAAMMP